MHTLKVQLGLTLSVLLSLSMLLFGMVLLTLWQRNMIDQETKSSQKLLQIAALSLTEADSTSSPTLPPAVRRFIDDSNILCLQYQLNRSNPIQTYGDCPVELSLSSLMENSIVYNNRQSHFSGMAWNGFFFTKKFLLTAQPLKQKKETSHKSGSVGLISSLQKNSAAIHKIQKIFLAYLVINLLIFVTIGFTRLVHLVVRPIQRLALLADSRTDQGDSSFFPGERWGEFTQLSLSLNRLVARIDGDKQELRSTVESLKLANEELQQNREEMIRTEKLASVGRLSAGLAHEIGNPLGIIQGYVDLLADTSLSDEDRKTFSERALQELTRINNLIRNLLDFSRTPIKSAVSTVNIHDLLLDLVETVRIRKNISEISYQTAFHALQAEVMIDSDGLRQVLLNCILNAIDAIEEQTEQEHGTIELRTENSAPNTHIPSITITLQDDGVGIAEENMDAIFDPFFTTKEVGKGTGLGLSVAHNLINKSGGHLSIASTAGVGTTVSVILPLSAQKPYTNKENNHDG